MPNGVHLRSVGFLRLVVSRRAVIWWGRMIDGYHVWWVGSCSVD